MFNLSIKMHSIEISKEIIDLKEKIRISITTLPEGQKQAHTYEAKKLNIIQPLFNIKFNESTEKIIVVLRKKSIFGFEPIIASTYMKTQDLDIFDSKMNEKKKIRLFEPISQGNEKRNIVGRLAIDFTIHEEKSHNCKDNSKMKSKKLCDHKYSKITIRNDNNDYQNLL